MPPEYPWYEEVEGQVIAQGDLLPNCPILQPSYDSALLYPTPEERTAEAAQAIAEPEVRTAVIYQHCVVMTQACDLENDKVGEVILCPYQAWDSFELAHPSYPIKKVRKGEIPSLLLIAPHADDPVLGLSVVSFREIYSVSRSFLELFAEQCGPRLRLLPPYREHLSQGFARYFMRVGLPQEIPS